MPEPVFGGLLETAAYLSRCGKSVSSWRGPKCSISTDFSQGNPVYGRERGQRRLPARVPRPEEVRRDNFIEGFPYWCCRGCRWCVVGRAAGGGRSRRGQSGGSLLSVGWGRRFFDFPAPRETRDGWFPGGVSVGGCWGVLGHGAGTACVGGGYRPLRSGRDPVRRCGAADWSRCQPAGGGTWCSGVRRDPRPTAGVEGR